MPQENVFLKRNPVLQGRYAIKIQANVVVALKAKSVLKGRSAIRKLKSAVIRKRISFSESNNKYQ
jgi:hypothetical protein